jgi:Glycosyl transferase family 11
MMGGLGNQLFMIATAYAYAKEYGCELVFADTWDHKAGREPIWITYFKDRLASLPWKTIPRDQHSAIGWHPIYESGFLYSPITAPNAKFSMLHGYFQSSKYFGEYQSEIRSMLQIHDDYLTQAKANLASAGIENPDGWIVAHVRRGDYLELPNYHVVTNAKFFNDARAAIAAKIRPRTVCWVSEDTKWVYENVFQQGDIVLSSDSMTDFATISLFRHVIMSNSSYSWWATWLNPCSYDSRVICCPDKWFGPTGHQDVETIFEPEWIRIETTSG